MDQPMAEEGIGSSSIPQPAPGKSFYQVSPKENTDVSQTSDFIKKIVQTEDILPRTHVNDHLMHWTVEASAEEVLLLQSNPGIDHVDELHFQNSPTATRSMRERSAIEDLDLPKREDSPDKKEYVVLPKDKKNQKEVEQTEKFLRDFLGDKDYVDSVVTDNRLSYWVCALSSSTLERVLQNPGVGDAGPVLVGKLA